jgi:methionine aminopeptidase
MFKVSFALRELMQIGVIRNYPPLPDKSHGLVSQAEHTIIVRDKPIVITL